MLLLVMLVVAVAVCVCRGDAHRPLDAAIGDQAAKDAGSGIFAALSGAEIGSPPAARTAMSTGATAGRSRLRRLFLVRRR